MQQLVCATLLTAVGVFATACATDRDAPAPEVSKVVEAKPVEAPVADPASAAEPPSAKKTFGEPITVAESTSLASIIADPNAYADQTVKTEGTVKAVCQSRGCWMEIGDDEGKAYVKMAGHSFFVPTDSKGRRATVQGKVVPGQPVSECGAKDGCRGEADDGAVAKLELVATGVTLLD